MEFMSIPFLIIVLVLLAVSVRIAKEYERYVVFRLGRVIANRGPGLFFLIPILESAVRVDMRTVTMDVPPQDAITRDNVTLKVNAVVYFKVVDPNRAVIEIEDYFRATSNLAQTTLRSILGEVELDELLAHREKINTKLQAILDDQTGPWGVKVTNVEVKQIDLPVEMQRAMARQAEAERERRAKIIAAEGEFEASQKLASAAHVMGQEPMTLQLRYLQTMVEISNERNTTTFIPFPVELLRGFVDMQKKNS
jgi:regulator of protease activity HflC (stomatin/prohibitin superfamily)